MYETDSSQSHNKQAWKLFRPTAMSFSHSVRPRNKNKKSKETDGVLYCTVLYSTVYVLTTLRKVALVWLATALASRVLPVPGGPYRITCILYCRAQYSTVK